MAAGGPDLTSLFMPLHALTQLFMGLTLGYLVLAAVATLESAGGIIDMIGGFMMSVDLDPLMMTRTAVMGRLNQLLAITLLFAGDGHLMVIQGLSRSAQLMPVPALTWEALGRTVTSAAGGVLLGAVQIAAPVMAAMLIVDVTLGLLTRAAPALNAFALGFPLKILFTLLLSGLVISRLPGVLETLIRQAVTTGMSLYGGG
jgi:flagellar biosynthesis protein FliR